MRPSTRVMPLARIWSAQRPTTAGPSVGRPPSDGSPLPTTTRSPLRTPPSTGPVATTLVVNVKSQPRRSAAAAIVTTFMLDAGMRNVPGLSEYSVSPVLSDLTSTPHTAFSNACV